MCYAISITMSKFTLSDDYVDEKENRAERFDDMNLKEEQLGGILPAIKGHDDDAQTLSGNGNTAKFSAYILLQKDEKNNVNPNKSLMCSSVPQEGRWLNSA